MTAMGFPWRIAYAGFGLYLSDSDKSGFSRSYLPHGTREGKADRCRSKDLDPVSRLRMRGHHNAQAL